MTKAVCGQSMSLVDASVLQGWLLCRNTHSLCGLGFGRLHALLEV